MRIRTIKPEFWRSDDIDALCIADRLLFIGLWSYVDDSGVGVDKPASIAADLFAGDLSRDPQECSVRVHGGLKRLCAAGLITRYSVDGRRFLHITNWRKHQKINRPTESRYPAPTSENATPHDELTEESVKTQADSPFGTGEQGNRGTGEVPPTADAPGVQLAVIHPATAPATPTAQTATAAWCDAFAENHDAKPTKQQRGQAAREAQALIDAGNPPDRVVIAARSAGSRGYPTIQREYRDLASRTRQERGSGSPQASTTNARVEAGVALAAKYRVQEAG